jgi:hypothetical protein
MGQKQIKERKERGKDQESKKQSREHFVFPNKVIYIQLFLIIA